MKKEFKGVRAKSGPVITLLGIFVDKSDPNEINSSMKQLITDY